MNSAWGKVDPFKEFAVRFWKRKVEGIIATGEWGSRPSEGELLSAYNDIKSRHPECKCAIEYAKKGLTRFLLPGDKVNEIRITRTITSDTYGNVTIEFSASTIFCVTFILKGNIPLIVKTSNYCNLSQTMARFEEFIENLPKNLTTFEKKYLENEKKKKLAVLTKNSIQASVKQLLATTAYTWELTEKGRQHELTVHMGESKAVKLTLNSRNFVKRISALQEVLAKTETFMESLPFPLDFTMTKAPGKKP